MDGGGAHPLLRLSLQIGICIRGLRTSPEIVFKLGTAIAFGLASLGALDPWSSDVVVVGRKAVML